MDVKLNAVHYKIWGIVQDRVFARKITDVDDLKQRIFDEWYKNNQQLIECHKTVA